MSDSRGPLRDVRIVDLTDERGIYGAKLLADLGADVVRPEPPDGDPLRRRGPHLAALSRGARGGTPRETALSRGARGGTPRETAPSRVAQGGALGGKDAPEKPTSLWHAFFASSRRFFSVDLDSEEGNAQLDALIDRAHIALCCAGAFGAERERLDAAMSRRPELVVLEVSSFGEAGPWRDYLAPDIVATALGGAAATTGDVDTPPLKAFGEAAFMLSGVYVAIGALAALHHARESETGQRVHIPVHECIASSLEHVLMWYWYHDRLPMAEGPVLERRAGLHWTNNFQTMPGRDGCIFVTAAPNRDAQLAWLIEEDAAGDLWDPKYEDPDNREEFTAALMQRLREWVATRDVEPLFWEGQARGLAYGLVVPIEGVADNPHLKARDWWVDYLAAIRGPGAPYHFGDTPWSIGPYGDIESDTGAVLSEIGWTRDP